MEYRYEVPVLNIPYWKIISDSAVKHLGSVYSYSFKHKKSTLSQKLHSACNSALGYKLCNTNGKSLTKLIISRNLP